VSQLVRHSVSVSVNYAVSDVATVGNVEPANW
jgi:hypothetical protein